MLTFVTGLSNIFALPLVANVIPSNIFTNVVLPAPFGPNRPNISPLPTLNETFSRAFIFSPENFFPESVSLMNLFQLHSYYYLLINFSLHL